MSQTQTKTGSATYSTVDIGNVIRRMRADLLMIADSTGGWSQETANGYAHDIEVLAVGGFLAHVDVTLFDDGVEKKATRFHVSTDAKGLVGERPGGVLWPRVAKPRLRLVVSYTDAYTAAARQATESKLKNTWTICTDDTSHAGLAPAGGRDYVSNSFGMQRKDWAA